MWASSWNPVSTPLTPALAGELPSSSPSWPPSSPTSSSLAAPLATPRGRWFRWPGAGCGARSPVVLFLHGGGFTAGAPSSYSGFCCELSRLADARVFAVAYRLAPEHRAPAGLDDVQAAYAWLLWHAARARVRRGRRRGRGQREAIAAALAAAAAVYVRTTCAAGSGVRHGGSWWWATRLAAGSFSCSCTGCEPVRNRCKRRLACHVPLPHRGAVAISPWLDLTGSGQSYFSNRGSEQLFRQRGAISGNADLGATWRPPRQAQPGMQRTVRPGGALARLPPLWLLASERELLRDDAIRAYASLRGADPHCQARLTVVPHVMHVFPIFLEAAPECREWAARIGDYVAEHVATATVTCTPLAVGART